jgi:hypothetical protein
LESEEIVLAVASIVIPVPAVKNRTTLLVSFQPRIAFAAGSVRLAPVPPSERAKTPGPEPGRKEEPIRGNHVPPGDAPPL